jgi:hypothetical protein
MDRSYRIIITTIALALFTLFWTTIDGQLKVLDARLRCMEIQVAAISASLGIRPDGLTSSAEAKSGAAYGSPLEDHPRP